MATDPISNLDAHRGRIVSHIGGWRPNEGAVYIHGENIFAPGVREESFVEILYFIITGKRPEGPFRSWLNTSYALYCCYPDARIWCNQIAGFAGKARTRAQSAVNAGLAAADSTFYGHAPHERIVPWLQKAMAETGLNVININNYVERYIINGKVLIPGFSKPISNLDERVVSLRALAKERGMQKGDYELFSEHVETFIQINYGDNINSGGYDSAVLLDNGLSCEQICILRSLSTTPGIIGCYIDALNHDETPLLPLRCDDVIYDGPEDRCL